MEGLLSIDDQDDYDQHDQDDHDQDYQDFFTTQDNLRQLKITPNNLRQFQTT